MENFFYNDEFYDEIGSLLDHLDLDEDDVRELDDDYKLECAESSLEPAIKITANWIADRFEERFPPDSERASKQIMAALLALDFEKCNALMPNFYYPARKEFTITKQDLIEYIF